ncbi:MAG: hypothetical protein LBG58_09800 [Planctomycetaceae bacterium]|nr:hypothetical protein [Planctomycetaceae bacterium]
MERHKKIFGTKMETLSADMGLGSVFCVLGKRYFPVICQWIFISGKIVCSFYKTGTRVSCLYELTVLTVSDAGETHTFLNSTDILHFPYLFTRLDVLHFAIDLFQRTPPLGVQRE